MTYRMKANELDFSHIMDLAKEAYDLLRRSERAKRKAYVVASKNEMLREFIPIFEYLTISELKTLTGACQLAETTEHKRFSPTKKLGIGILNKKERKVYAKALGLLERYNDLIQMEDAKWVK